jgi:isopentenyldiphosphate isomerase
MFDLIYPPDPAPIIPHPTADNPFPSISKSGEMVPIVETSGLVIGQATREYCHSGAKPLHPVVHLHIINRFDKLYLQKRSMKKDLLQGKWDTAVGGHIDYGERLLEALFRESHEELGFMEFNPIYLQTYLFESDIEKELVNVFAAVGNFTLHPDRNEVSEGKYWTMEDIEKNIGKSVFTPNFEGEFKAIRKELESLL